MDQVMLSLLRTARTVAVVGYSSSPDRPSNHVAQFLVEVAKYKVWGINPALAPGVDALTGVHVVPSLKDAGPVDIVDVFRRSDALQEVFGDVTKAALVAAPPKAVWLQEGVQNEPLEQAFAKESGITVVSNRCILKEYMRLIGE